MINKVTVGDRINRAQGRYLEAMERLNRALAEVPTGLDELGRLVAIDRILSDCAETLDALAADIPSTQQTRVLSPDLAAAVEDFRCSLNAVRATIPVNRRPILASIAALQPGQN